MSTTYFSSRYQDASYITLPETTSTKWVFQCHENHTHSISRNAFLERVKSLQSGKFRYMCSICEKDRSKLDQIQKWKEVCESRGFTFISYESRTIKYQCVCGNLTQNQDTHIKSFTGCKKCSQKKLDHQYLVDIFREAGCTLLTLEEEYTGNKQKLRYLCTCGEEGMTILHDFKIGNRCGKCRSEKTKATCLAKYGVANVSQLPESKEKSKETCLRVYGVEHHAQCEEVQQKKEESCMISHGVKTVLLLPEIQEKAHDAMEEKYGVRHGLQIGEVMEKIRAQNRERYGTDYLFQSQVFWDEYNLKYMQKYGVKFHTQLDEWKQKVKQICLMRYGVEHFVTSDAMKTMMMERYGVEHASQSEEVQQKMKETCLMRYGVEYFFTSDAMKAMMMERYGVEYASQSEEVQQRMKETCLMRYGVEYPMQNYEIFRKAAKSMYSKKQYILPSGKEIQLMGYEWMCFDILLGIKCSKKYTGEIYQESDFTLIPPIIPYFHDEKNRMYYPDIFVKGIVIEVKSIWTFNMTTDRNHTKFLKTAKLYPFQVWIFNQKELIDILTYSPEGATFSNGTPYNGKKLTDRCEEEREEEVCYDLIKSISEEL